MNGSRGAARAHAEAQGHSRRGDSSPPFMRFWRQSRCCFVLALDGVVEKEFFLVFRFVLAKYDVELAEDFDLP